MRSAAARKISCSAVDLPHERKYCSLLGQWKLRAVAVKRARATQPAGDGQVSPVARALRLPRRPLAVRACGGRQSAAFTIAVGRDRDWRLISGTPEARNLIRGGRSSGVQVSAHQRSRTGRHCRVLRGHFDFYDWIGDGRALLFSHPKDFTPVCTTERGVVAALKPEFEARRCTVIGFRVDGVSDHEAWSQDIAALQGRASLSLRRPILRQPQRPAASHCSSRQSALGRYWSDRSMPTVGGYFVSAVMFSAIASAGTIRGS